MNRQFILGALTVVIALSAGQAALAQTPPPSPAPFPGFSATGMLALQASVAGTPVNIGAQVAVMQKDRRVRIDLLHLDLPQSGAGANATVTPFVPHGTVTLVYDQRTGTTTIWSAEKRVYYQRKGHVTAKATPAPKPAPNRSSPIEQVLHATNSMTQYDVFNSSFALTGHQPVNGHTASLFHFTVQSQKHGAKLQDVSGDLALADDLSGIPIRFWVAVKGDVEGSLKLDLLSASAVAPDNSVFAVPSGYKKVASVLQVLSNAPAP